MVFRISTILAALVFLTSLSAYSSHGEQAKKPMEACTELLAASNPHKGTMDRWLTKIQASATIPPNYPRILVNEYGALWDHHNFVLTYSEAELLMYQLKFQDGLAYLGQNSKPLSTDSQLQRLGLRPLGNLFAGKLWMYIMTCEGTIFLIPAGLDIKHSSLGDAVCVAAAGWMNVHKGKIIYIDNNSGHYHPNPFSVAQVLFELHVQGIDISQIDYDLIGLQ